jgi:hypothetical protein
MTFKKISVLVEGHFISYSQCMSWSSGTNIKKTYSEVWVGKNLPDLFSIQIGLKQGGALLSFVFNMAF